jgi:putative Ca2+/H+ antiporter (TMEM165/GDT1 family)
MDSGLDLKMLFTVLVTVFLAELGDKTQLATMAFAAGKEVNPWIVFAGASIGLVLAAAMGVIAGQLLASWLNPKWMTLAAGVAFVAIGLLTVRSALTL